jgi:hypothetical protein
MRFIPSNPPSATGKVPAAGHKTASVFRRYDIISPEDLRDAAKLDQPAAKQQRT